MAVLSGVISGIDPEAEPAVLVLNNLHARELSWLDAARLRHLVGAAFMASRIGNADAFIIAFDQDADYDSPNFLWLRARLSRFVYVDRVAVAETARGRGLARQLYAELFEQARKAGHDRVTCEVNAEPPNPQSDAFHAALGFTQIGEAMLDGGAKRVRYLEKRL